MAEPFAPVVDGVYVSDQPYEMLKKSKFTKPTIIEYSQNEGEKFIMQVFGSDPKRNETGPMGKYRSYSRLDLADFTPYIQDLHRIYRIVYICRVQCGP